MRQPGRGRHGYEVEGEGAVVSATSWLVILGSSLSGLVFCRAAYTESVRRKRALIEQTIEYERLRGEPHS